MESERVAPAHERAHLQLTVVAIVGTLAAGIAIWIAGRPVNHSAPPPQQAASIRFWSDPIGPGASETTGFTAATDGLPFTPILPPDNDDGIQRVWLRTAREPALAVRFESGVTILERLAEPIDFPTKAYYSQLAVGLPGSSVTVINEAPAMVIQSTVELGNPSSVDVILQGVHISIIGNVAQNAEELVALADSFEATGSGQAIR